MLPNWKGNVDVDNTLACMESKGNEYILKVQIPTLNETLIIEKWTCEDKYGCGKGHCTGSY